MTIINRNFKTFFLYTNYNVEELELIKNYCCKRTIHYIDILQGKIKIYDEEDTRNINFPFRRTIQALETEKERNKDFYEDFYNSFIIQLKNYKDLHDNNNNNESVVVYENISIFSTLIYDLLRYVMFFYTSQ